MHQINLTEEAFKEAERRAKEAGFASVDEFIADLVSQDVPGGPGEFDYVFTPERLAHIDKAEADITGGKFFTAEQADAELAKRRAEWNRKNPS